MRGNNGSLQAWFERGEVCRDRLVDWNSDPEHNPKIRVARIKERLHQLTVQCQSAEVRTERAMLSIELERVYADLAIYWQQRSKVDWMRDGDQNTAFFHSKASTWAQINKVEALQDCNGVVRRERNEMENMVLNYFDGLFSSSQPEGALMGQVLEAIESRVSVEANHTLTLSRLKR